MMAVLLSWLSQHCGHSELLVANPYPGKAETISCVASRPGCRLEQLGVLATQAPVPLGPRRIALSLYKCGVLSFGQLVTAREFSRSYSLPKVKDLVVPRPKNWSGLLVSTCSG